MARPVLHVEQVAGLYTKVVQWRSGRDTRVIGVLVASGTPVEMQDCPFWKAGTGRVAAT